MGVPDYVKDAAICGLCSCPFLNSRQSHGPQFLDTRNPKSRFSITDPGSNLDPDPRPQIRDLQFLFTHALQG